MSMLSSPILRHSTLKVARSPKLRYCDVTLFCGVNLGWREIIFTSRSKQMIHQRVKVWNNLSSNYEFTAFIYNLYCKQQVNNIKLLYKNPYLTFTVRTNEFCKWAWRWLRISIYFYKMVMSWKHFLKLSVRCNRY